MCMLCYQLSRQAAGSETVSQQAAIGSISGVPSTGVNHIDSLLNGISWTGNANQGATVTYTFSRSEEGGSLFNSFQQGQAIAAMQAWSNVANINFVNIGSGGNLTFSQGNLGDGVLGLATTFTTGTRIVSSESQIFNGYTNSDLQVGEDGFLTLLHEIGHSIGLKHSGNYGDGTPSPFLPTSEENLQASVMSYNDGLVIKDQTNPPRTPMIYDIAAVQYLYGANRAYNSGNNTYSFDGSAQSMTIWDGGGTDSISAVGTSGTNIINLGEGYNALTQIGSSYALIAFGANIENAFGGNGVDTIAGNGLNNQLYGSGGNDFLQGGEGNDTLFGGNAVGDPNDGSDTLRGDGGNDTIYANAGNDLIFGGTGSVDGGDGSDLIYAGFGADTIYGNAGNDSLYGGGGSADPNDLADVIYGGNGSDFIFGNGGNDSLFGGGGIADPNDGPDTIYGGAGNDYILSNGGNDFVSAGEGSDTIHGGAGGNIFLFEGNSGQDRLLQFSAPGDTLVDIIQIQRNINNSGIFTPQDVLGRIVYTGGGAQINFGSGHVLTIDNIASGSFTASDFQIV